MTINELLLFVFFIANLLIFLAKTYNLMNLTNWYDIRIGLILLMVSLISNSIVLTTAISLVSAKIIEPEKPSQSVSYVVDVPPNQQVISSYASRISGFITTIIAIFTILEVLFALKNLPKNMRYRRYY